MWLSRDLQKKQRRFAFLESMAGGGLAVGFSAIPEAC